jgi:hypothetical protein
MTDLNSLTLAEIEALAERLSAAAKVFREAQAMFGGQSMAPASGIEPGVIAPRFANPNAPTNGAPKWSASELAEKERLRNQFTPPPEGA